MIDTIAVIAVLLMIVCMVRETMIDTIAVIAVLLMIVCMVISIFSPRSWKR